MGCTLAAAVALDSLPKLAPWGWRANDPALTVAGRRLPGQLPSRLQPAEDAEAEKEGEGRARNGARSPRATAAACPMATSRSARSWPALEILIQLASRFPPPRSASHPTAVGLHSCRTHEGGVAGGSSSGTEVARSGKEMMLPRGKRRPTDHRIGGLSAQNGVRAARSADSRFPRLINPHRGLGGTLHRLCRSHTASGPVSPR